MPSNTLVGALRVEASIDAGKFVDGAKQISNVSKATESAVKSAFSGISSAIKGGIAGFTGALSVAGFVAIVQSSLEFAKSLQSTSQQLGVSTKDLQTYRFAAAQVGVSNEQLDTGFKFLEKSIGKAIAGSEPAQKAFASVGVSLDDLKNKTRPEIFNQVADGMAKQGGAARNAAAATAIFGKSASDLNPLLDQGSTGIDNLTKAAEDLGVVLSQDEIKNANVTATKLADLKTVLQVSIAEDVIANADAILALADALATLARTIPTAVAGWKQAIAEFNAFGGAIGQDIGAAFHGGNFVNPITAVNQATEDAKIHAFLAAHNEPLFPVSPTPTGNVPQFLKGPKKGRAPKQHADRSQEILDQMDKEILQADQSILQAKQQLAGSSEERLQISIQLVELEKTVKDKAVDEEVAKDKRQITEEKLGATKTAQAFQEIDARARILKAANAIEEQTKLRAIVEEQLAKAEQANFELADQQYKFQQDALKVADQLATNQADHRRIQLAILDSEIAQQRLELQHEKDLAVRNGGTKEEIAVIQAKIDNLDAQQAQGQATILKNTENPLQAWARDVPKTAQDIVEGFQKIEVDGIDQLTNAFAGVISGTESLKQAFSNMASSIVAEIAQMIVKMMLFRALSSVLGLAGGFDSSSFSGTVASNNAALGGSLNAIPTGPLPGFASGGTIMVGARSGIDMNVLSMNNMPIARVSYGEAINIGNDNMPQGPALPPLTMYNDFRGADPAAVSQLRSRLDQMQAEFPYRVVQAWYDAYSRNVIRP